MNAPATKPAAPKAPARRQPRKATAQPSDETIAKADGIAKGLIAAKKQDKAPTADEPNPADAAKAATFFAQLDAKQPKKDAKGAAKPVKAAKAPKEPKAPKPAKVIVPFSPRKLGAKKAVHIIAEDARPTSGARLFAHTHAALCMLGLLDDARPAVPEKALLTVMGQRAVTYHKKQNNFESVKDHGIRATPAGHAMFRARLAEGKVDGGIANDYLALFLDGKAAASTGVQEGKVYQAALA